MHIVSLIKKTALITLLFSIYQTGYAQLEEIVVTAQKREESLQDVPITMQAFGGEMINELGVNRAVDIVNHAPNINLSGQNQANRAIAIRGIGTSDFFGASPGSVGIYMDDVTMSSPYLTSVGLFDMERVEILRGPQNTLFGRNTTGGAINYLSRMPEVGGDREGFARVTYGRHNRIEVEAASTFQLSDRAAIRVAGKSYDRDGIWNDMGNNGAEFGEKDQKSARATLVWEPTQRTTVTANVHWGDENSQVDPLRLIGTRTSSTGLLNVADPTTFVSGQQLVWEGVNYNTYNAQGVDASFPEWENISHTGSDGHDLEALGFFLKIRHDMDWGTVTSITAYDDSETRFTVDSGGQGNITPTPVSIAAGLNQPEENIIIDQDQRFEQFSQEIRIQSNQDQRLRWIAGFYYFQEDSELAQNIRFGVGIPVLSPNPGCGIPGPPAIQGGSLGLWGVSQGFACGFPGTGFSDIMSFSVATMENEVFSPYGQIEYNVTDDLKFTLGLRYTDDTKEIPSYFVGFLDITGIATDTFFSQELLRSTAAAQVGAGSAATVCTGGMFCAQDTTRGDLHAKEWGGKVGIDWHFAEDKMAYVNYSRGFRSGRYDVEFLHGPQTGFPLADSTPETLDAYEIGTKMSFMDNSVQFNAAAFFYEWNNKQAFFVDPVTGPAFGNIPSSEAYGLELELKWSPTADTFISAGLGLMDSEITEASPLPFDQQGHELQQAPDLSWNVLANKDFQVGGNLLTLQIDFAYRDESSNSLATADLSDKLGSAFGENILESRYCSYMFGLAAINGSVTCLANDGQAMWGIQGGIRF
jgi:iron complex outermembrane receptor protein